MRCTWRKAAIAAAMIVAMGRLKAQVQNDFMGNYWLEPTNPTPQSFAIGPAPATGYALEVHGELLTPPIGDVFRTDAPASANTNWSLLRGGIERGRLFNNTGEVHFGLNATTGSMRLLTNSAERMRVYRSQSTTINGISVNQTGFVGISGQPAFFTASATPGPLSRLHLVDRGDGSTDVTYYAPTLAHRRWMRNGVSFTGNSDHGYLGQKYRLNTGGVQVRDLTDMVLHWSNDVPGEFGPDRLRFLFTTTPNGSAYGSRSEEGLEAMRFTPINATTVNAGLGDFYAGNILDPTNVTEPTERFDILNGRLRIRELVESTGEAHGTYKVMVVDDAPYPSTERRGEVCGPLGVRGGRFRLRLDDGSDREQDDHRYGRCG